MKKIALILCLVLVASFVLSGCNNSDSIITLEDREVGKIEIQSGNTGETVEVTEEEVISQIADILSLEFEKGEKSNDSTGWSYSVRWYDTEGKQIDTVVIMNDGTIEKDGYFWKTSKDNIELSVFDELVTKHSSELPLEWDKIPMVMVDGKLYYDILNVSLLYNSLPEEQQLAISAVPPDLLEESGLVKTEDAEVSAQEDELCGYPLAPEEVE